VGIKNVEDGKMEEESDIDGEGIAFSTELSGLVSFIPSSKKIIMYVSNVEKPIELNVRENIFLFYSLI